MKKIMLLCCTLIPAYGAASQLRIFNNQDVPRQVSVFDIDDIYEEPLPIANTLIWPKSLEIIGAINPAAQLKIIATADARNTIEDTLTMHPAQPILLVINQNDSLDVHEVITDFAGNITAVSPSQSLKSDISAGLKQFSQLRYSAIAQQLSDAIGLGDITITKQILDEYPSLINAQITDYAMPPILISIMGDTQNPDVFEYLIMRGANINAQTSRGNTALIIASREVDVKPSIVKLLVQHGAKRYIRNEDGQDALGSAQETLSRLEKQCAAELSDRCFGLLKETLEKIELLKQQ